MTPRCRTYFHLYCCTRVNRSPAHGFLDALQFLCYFGKYSQWNTSFMLKNNRELNFQLSFYGISWILFFVQLTVIRSSPEMALWYRPIKSRELFSSNQNYFTRV